MTILAYAFPDVICTYSSTSGVVDMTSNAQEGGISFTMSVDQTEKQVGAGGQVMYSGIS